MLQIRLTKSAAKDLKITTLDAPVSQDGPFNDWFMNVFILHRKKVAIFTHGATKLSFFSPYSDIGGSKNLLSSLKNKLHEYLVKIDCCHLGVNASWDKKSFRLYDTHKFC